MAVQRVGYGGACSFPVSSGLPLLFLVLSRIYGCEVFPVPFFFFYSVVCLREVEWQDSMVLGIFLQTLRVVFLPYKSQMCNLIVLVSQWQNELWPLAMFFSFHWWWVDKHHLPPFLRWLYISCCPGETTWDSVPLCARYRQALRWVEKRLCFCTQEGRKETYSSLWAWREREKDHWQRGWPCRSQAGSGWPREILLCLNVAV